MTGGFRVDLGALTAAGDHLDWIGAAVGELNVADALKASCSGVGAENTAVALDELALRLTAAVAGYAVDTVALATKTGATAADYATIDEGVVSSIRGLAS